MVHPLLFGKVAIVTGAADGIGRATAEALASRGARVVVADSHVGLGREVAASLENAVFESTDLSSVDSINTLVSRAVESLGRIDILANMASINYAESVLACTPEAWSDVIDTTLRATFLMSQAVAHEMKRLGGGAIINLASDAAFQPAPRMAIESAARGGIFALSRTLAYELAPHNIRVNVIAPDYAGSEAMRAGLFLDGESDASTVSPSVDPREVAPTVVFLASEAASGMTGACINVNRGGVMPH